MPHSVLLKNFYDESLDEVAPGVYHVTRKQLRGGDVKKMSTEEKMIARIKNVRQIIPIQKQRILQNVLATRNRIKEEHLARAFCCIENAIRERSFCINHILAI